MESIKEIYKIGYGPSSSHTMGPGRAAKMFVQKYPNAEKYRAKLYGSLALTGKGHGTDKAIRNMMGITDDSLEIIFKNNETLAYHPNGMIFETLKGSVVENSWEVYSIGGGSLYDKQGTFDISSVYDLTFMSDILDWCDDEGSTLFNYVEKCEGNGIYDYLAKVWNQMQKTIEKGLITEGVLPGTLKLARKACRYNIRSQQSIDSLHSTGMLFAAALATSEENAGGGIVTTAPTCGASGVVPAVLYYMKHDQHVDEKRILRGLATAGLIGTIVKENGSISGAEVGCQGELGTACAMGAAAMTQIWGGTPRQIEYAAEMGFEHNLGLTCDPIGGYVQIPCIERNTFVAQKAREIAQYALFSDGTHWVSFDDVVETMTETGRDMQLKYRETSLGGLAQLKIKRFHEKTGKKLNF